MKLIAYALSLLWTLSCTLPAKSPTNTEMEELPPLREQASLGRDPAYCGSLKRNLKLGEECIRSNEESYYNSLAERIAKIQRQLPDNPKNQLNLDSHGGMRRTFHAKGHACVKGYLEPMANRPASARAGIFATDLKRPTWVRFSNAQGLIQNDIEKDAAVWLLKSWALPTAPAIWLASRQITLKHKIF
jgi:hypothetical protein